MESRRELDQLFLVASHYLRQAKRTSRRHPAILSRTLRKVTSEHADGKLQPEELLLAHLASCAIRLSTICEKESTKFPPSYRSQFYKRDRSIKDSMSKEQIRARITQKLDQHIHFLLRDHVGHEENKKSEMACDRLEILLPLTISRVLLEFDSCAKTVRAKLLT
jgi:organic hydroperoxide reductase OsmC/OhrA